MQPDAICIEHVTHVYPARNKKQPPVIANDDVSFTVCRGEVFGLLGPNGAGKTTLVHQVLGLLPPTAGHIRLDGIDVARYPQRVKQITGFLPQSGMPMRNLEVERALHYTGRLRGQSEGDARRQVRQLIEELELGDYAHRYVNKLSGGLMRLVNFAMSLMGAPHFLVLDEPTNALDPYKRRVIWNLIARLNREQGVTCLLVTHNVLEAELVVSRVAVMQSGKIVALGTPGELKSTDRVRLELRLKEGETLRPGDAQALESFSKLEELRPGHYRLYLSSGQVASAVDQMINLIGLARLDDFRLAPPSLEDVYLELNQPEPESEP